MKAGHVQSVRVRSPTKRSSCALGNQPEPRPVPASAGPTSEATACRTTWTPASTSTITEDGLGPQERRALQGRRTTWWPRTPTPSTGPQAPRRRRGQRSTQLVETGRLRIRRLLRHLLQVREGACCAPTAQVGFSTPSGRIELVPYATFRRLGHRPVARSTTSSWPMPTSGLTDEPEFRKEYPFIMRERHRAPTSSSIPRTASRRPCASSTRCPIVQVSNDQAAEAYGISRGRVGVAGEPREGRCQPEARSSTPRCDRELRGTPSTVGGSPKSDGHAFPQPVRHRGTCNINNLTGVLRDGARRHRLPRSRASSGKHLQGHARKRRAHAGPGGHAAERLPQQLRGGLAAQSYGQ